MSVAPLAKAHAIPRPIAMLRKSIPHYSAAVMVAVLGSNFTFFYTMQQPANRTGYERAIDTLSLIHI